MKLPASWGADLNGFSKSHSKSISQALFLAPTCLGLALNALKLLLISSVGFVASSLLEDGWISPVTYYFGSARWTVDENQTGFDFLILAAGLALDLPGAVYASIPISKALRPINLAFAILIPFKLWLIYQNRTVGLSGWGSFIFWAVGNNLINIGCLLRLLKDATRERYQFSLRKMISIFTVLSICLATWRVVGGPAGATIAVACSLCMLPWGIWNAYHYYATRPLIAALTFHLWRNFWWTMVAGISSGEQLWQSSLRGTLLSIDLPLAVGRYLFVKTATNPLQLTEWQRDFAASIVGSLIWFLAIYATTTWLNRKDRHHGVQRSEN